MTVEISTRLFNQNGIVDKLAGNNTRQLVTSLFVAIIANAWHGKAFDGFSVFAK